MNFTKQLKGTRPTQLVGGRLCFLDDVYQAT